MKRLLAWCVSLSLLCTACVHSMDYQPTTMLLQRLTREEAAERSAISSSGR